jgi:hypothetical protein
MQSNFIRVTNKEGEFFINTGHITFIKSIGASEIDIYFTGGTPSHLVATISMRDFLGSLNK